MAAHRIPSAFESYRVTFGNDAHRFECFGRGRDSERYVASELFRVYVTFGKIREARH